MPPKSLKIVQHKHSAKSCVTPTTQGECAPTTRSGPLLFVHRDQENVQGVRSARELEQIKQHLAQRHQKRRKVQQKLEIHPSINRILRQPTTDDDGDQTVHEDAMSLAPTSDRSTLEASQGPFGSSIESSSRDALSANMISDGALDPFTPLQEPSLEVRRLLFLYCKQLRPLARTVSSEWDWIGNLGEIQSSPMLTYAIASYASAFSTGMRSGARGVALPPMPERGRPALWPMPIWFRFQTQALSLLNTALLDKQNGATMEIFHTIVFLFRLAVLLGDGLTANMHFKALRQVAKMQGRDAEDLSRELVVTRINFITLYLYKAALVKKRQRVITQEYPDYVIEPDREKWTDENEWNKFQGMLLCRSLTWNARSPGSLPQTEARRNILRLDPTSARLSDDILHDVVRMYQVALYLWGYLTSIAFDTSFPKIRFHANELEQYLRQSDIERIEINAPKVVFILFFVGAFSSRGDPIRKWFISKLATTRIQVRYMRDVHAELDGHCDPMHCAPILLEEMLLEIRKAKEGTKLISKTDLYQGTFYEAKHGQTPMSKSPDLETPIRDLEEPEG